MVITQILTISWQFRPWFSLENKLRFDPRCGRAERLLREYDSYNWIISQAAHEICMELLIQFNIFNLSSSWPHLHSVVNYHMVLGLSRPILVDFPE